MVDFFIWLKSAIAELRVNRPQLSLDERTGWDKCLDELEKKLRYQQIKD